MPVVEKILKERFDDGENVFLKTFGLINEGGEFMVRFNRYSLFMEESLLEATYFAVIEFLRNRG